MTRLTFTITRSQGVITIRVPAGRYVEHIDTAYKTHTEIFDAVHVALMTAGISTSDQLMLAELIRDLGGR